jgi:hypothetical protein
MSVKEKVQKFLQKSPLWTEDPIAINDIRKDVMSMNPHDPSIRHLDELIRLSLTDGVRENEFSQEYFVCLASLFEVLRSQ